MNIVIFSGGSGNDTLINGIKKLYKNVNIKVIVNAYDNGKSTGICRCVTNTLGVSDIRKNHIRMYLATKSIVDNRLVDFYTSRFNFTKTTIVDDILTKLDDWGLHKLKKFVIDFFNTTNAYNFEYKDFNIANIVYSQMYKELGYEKTNSYFCNLLEIEDFVLLNSFDNIYINAITEGGLLLDDEEKIVNFANSNDRISKILYRGITPACKLNILAVESIKNADLIIVSTGTMWSSIYPTLDYLDLYKVVNAATAKKVWVMNNTEDKDAYGVTSNDFISVLSNLGLDLSKFTILENISSSDILHLKNKNYNIVYSEMGNIKGKHDGNLLAKEMFRIYYGIENSTFDYYVFDFDDTLYARDSVKNNSLLDKSVKNLTLINDKLKDKSIIISGNDYESIKTKLYNIFGTSSNSFTVPIWADANSTLFNNYEYVKTIGEFKINSANVTKLINYLTTNYGLSVTVNTSDTCIKIKPLTKIERKLLVDLLPNIFKELDIKDCKGIISGRTTVDIVNKNNDKSNLLSFIGIDKYNILYVGDEVDFGNDECIAKKCKLSINTSGVDETNLILNLLD